MRFCPTHACVPDGGAPGKGGLHMRALSPVQVGDNFAMMTLREWRLSTFSTMQRCGRPYVFHRQRVVSGAPRAPRPLRSPYASSCVQLVNPQVDCYVSVNPQVDGMVMLPKSGLASDRLLTIGGPQNATHDTLPVDFLLLASVKGTGVRTRSNNSKCPCDKGKESSDCMR